MSLIVLLYPNNAPNLLNFNFFNFRLRVKGVAFVAKDLHWLIFCLYVVDPATILASNDVLGTLFSSLNSFVIQWWKK